MASIEIVNMTKKFGENVVIENMNLKIEDGKFTVLVGPSGCGKTTLLRTIAGIETPTSGKVLINGQDMSKVATGKRDVAMVFQNYALYPTMSVRQNIEFGLKNNKIKKDKRKELIQSISSIVGLTHYLDRKPSDLSGGQRQRVALARAMVKEPSIFLMDEPLSNLDAKLRVQMRMELIELHKQLGTTFVYVTHDQVEAMAMADTIVLMNKGAIQQEGSPEVIYHQPQNTFTAQFMGVPPMNIAEIGVSDVTYGFRPEKVNLLIKPLESNGFNIKGVIITREMLGSETVYQVRSKRNNLTFMVKSVQDDFHVDQEVYLSVEQKDFYFFDSDGERISNGDTHYSNLLEILNQDTNARLRG